MYRNIMVRILLRRDVTEFVLWVLIRPLLARYRRCRTRPLRRHGLPGEYLIGNETIRTGRKVW